MKKILFLGAASERDPKFEDVYDKSLLNSKGIDVTDPVVIESCHGCPDIMTEYSNQMQSLVEKGHRVVSVLEGGLYFALPSIQATQTTYPIISCGLDKIAYQGIYVPSGNSAIAGVSVERKTKDGYETKQRKKAIDIAEKILNLDEDTVRVYSQNERIKKMLDDFKIETSRDSNLVLSHYHYPPPADNNQIQVWSFKHGGDYFLSTIEQLNSYMESAPNTVQVRGDKNLVTFAAKILSLQRPDIREKIKEVGRKKRETYEKRDLIKELVGD
jgi:phosphoribosylcarboxyaminoimidazole (NCAIR) mutase